MLKVSDVGVSQKGSEKKDTKPNSELDVYKINLTLELVYYFHKLYKYQFH